MTRLVRRYEGYVVRRLTPHVGEERARQEGPSRARFILAVAAWTILVAAAAIVRLAGLPAASFVCDAAVIAWLPVIGLAWIRLRRAQRP